MLNEFSCWFCRPSWCAPVSRKNGKPLTGTCRWSVNVIRRMNHTDQPWIQKHHGQVWDLVSCSVWTIVSLLRTSHETSDFPGNSFFGRIRSGKSRSDLEVKWLPREFRTGSSEVKWLPREFRTGIPREFRTGSSRESSYFPEWLSQLSCLHHARAGILWKIKLYCHATCIECPVLKGSLMRKVRTVIVI